MDLLQKIAAHKRIEVREAKKFCPLESFRKDLTLSQRDFKTALSQEKELPNLIAEIKKASPSAGMIRSDFNPPKIAAIYEKFAAAISVLTDEKFFEGKLEYIKAVSEITTIPLLRKDFIIDEYQIYEARYFGADAILLIAGLLDSAEITKFIKIAQSLKMDCLVEIHNKEEFAKVLKTPTQIIGINNRNLSNFEIDLDTTLQLSSKIKNHFQAQKNKPLLVCESGLHSRADLEKIKNAVQAVLIGTSFMKSPDIEAKIKKLFY